MFWFCLLKFNLLDRCLCMILLFSNDIGCLFSFISLIISVLVMVDLFELENLVKNIVKFCWLCGGLVWCNWVIILGKLNYLGMFRFLCSCLCSFVFEMFRIVVFGLILFLGLYCVWFCIQIICLKLIILMLILF